MDQRIISLYDDFTHGGMSRRDFMDRLTKLAGSSAGAAALLPVLQNNYAAAAVVAPNDPRLAIEEASFPGPKGAVKGTLMRPKAAAGKLPAVLVIHENRGLNPHIEDVARRLALEGFLAFGIDFLSVAGGTPQDEDKARDMIGALDLANTQAEGVAAIDWLSGLPQSTGAVGAVGFCWGGGMVNRLAAASPRLKAGVAYYGAQIPAEQAARIKGALLLHYAGLDERINAGIPAYRAALKAAQVRHTIQVYEGVNHAFNNDTNAARYDKAAADLAWSRTVAFLKQELA